MEKDAHEWLVSVSEWWSWACEVSQSLNGYIRTVGNVGSWVQARQFGLVRVTKELLYQRVCLQEIFNDQLLLEECTEWILTEFAWWKSSEGLCAKGSVPRVVLLGDGRIFGRWVLREGH